MISVLPASVEAYLKEAGFTVTEILVIRRMIEEDALTLRELATKTGKSTGVLDQAIKRLLAKHIMRREMINDTPRYALISLEALSSWLERDRKEKQMLLDKRHRNFETFLASVHIDKHRPEMQYFEGDDGIQKAYLQLLTQGKEMLSYLPITCKEEEDPLKDFKVQFFRDRRYKKIFSRIIAHDSPLASRFASRDPFEYRKTLLVPESTLNIPFEKIICGDTVACFEHTLKRACFIRYAKFAEAEKEAFERVWGSESEKQTTVLLADPHASENMQTVSIKTRILSALREFFLNKANFIMMLILLLLSAASSVFLHYYTQRLDLLRVREQVTSIAKAGAIQLNAADLQELQTEPDYKKPEWKKVVNTLHDIKSSNTNIPFVYLLRKSPNDPNGMLFIGDADSINPYANVDTDQANDVDANKDGKIEPDGGDRLQWPGQVYPEPPAEAFLAYDAPISSQDIYSDSWGSQISGYAPVRDENGTAVAVLAVDYLASELYTFSLANLTPVYTMLVLLLVFIVIRFEAMNRSLMDDIRSCIAKTFSRTTS